MHYQSDEDKLPQPYQPSRTERVCNGIKSVTGTVAGGIGALSSSLITILASLSVSSYIEKKDNVYGIESWRDIIAIVVGFIIIYFAFPMSRSTVRDSASNVKKDLTKHVTTIKEICCSTPREKTVGRIICEVLNSGRMGAASGFKNVSVFTIYALIEQNIENKQLFYFLSALLFGLHLTSNGIFQYGQAEVPENFAAYDAKVEMLYGGNRSPIHIMKLESGIFTVTNSLKNFFLGVGWKYFHMVLEDDYSEFHPVKDGATIVGLLFLAMLVSYSDFLGSLKRVYETRLLEKDGENLKAYTGGLNEHLLTLQEELDKVEFVAINQRTQLILNQAQTIIVKRAGVSCWKELWKGLWWDSIDCSSIASAAGRGLQTFSGAFPFFILMFSFAIPSATGYIATGGIVAAITTFFARKPMWSQRSLSTAIDKFKLIKEEQARVSNAASQLLTLIKDPHGSFSEVQLSKLREYTGPVDSFMKQPPEFLSPQAKAQDAAAAFRAAGPPMDPMRAPLLPADSLRSVVVDEMKHNPGDLDEQKERPDYSIDHMLRVLPSTLDIRGGKISLGPIISYLEIPRTYIRARKTYIHARKENHRCLMVGYRDYLVLYLFNLDLKPLFNQTIYYKAPYLAMTHLPLEFERSESFRIPTHFTWGGTRADIVNIIAPLFEEPSVA